MLRADASPFVPKSFQHEIHVECIHERQAGIQKISRTRRRRRKTNTPEPDFIPDDLNTEPSPECNNEKISSSWASIALKGHTDQIKAECALIQKQVETLNNLTESHTKLHRLGRKLPLDAKNQKCPIVHEIHSKPTHHALLPPINRYFKSHLVNTANFFSRWLSVKAEIRESKVALIEATTISNKLEFYYDHDSDLSPPMDNLKSQVCHDELPFFQHDNEIPSQHPYPWHDAILRNDESIFTTLLSSRASQNLMPTEDLALSSRIKALMKKYGILNVSPIQLCVINNRSKFLRLLLEYSLDHLNDPLLPLVFLATMTSSNECLLGILQIAGPSIVFTRSFNTGDTPLHVACKTDQISSVQTILSFACGKTVNNAKFLQKLICCQNSNGETPLHLACAYSRLQTLEVILSKCTTSCGTKLLRIKDKDDKTPLFTALARGSIDAVIHLLMWRGNHRDNKMIRAESSEIFYCPLSFAAWTGSIDMISILLEYGDQSNTIAYHEYNVQQALYQAMLSFEPSKYRQVINILVKGGGATPHNFPYPKPLTHPFTHKIISNISPLKAAIQHGNYEFIDYILDEYFTNLETTRMLRRQDSALFKQPITYLTNLESKEDDILNDAIQDALIQSILLAWRCIQQDSCDEMSTETWNHLRSYLSIVRRYSSVSASSIIRLYLDQLGKLPSFSLTFSYEHPYMECTTLNHMVPVSTYDRSGAKGWSMTLAQMEWFKELKCDMYCPWFYSNQWGGNCALDMDLFTIVCNDGTKFIAHKSIISQKSEKIKAAIHFSETLSSVSHTTIQLDGASNILILFLSHCYHGSIFFGLPIDCTELLLDLYVLAEEYLCSTLARECEMRLMSEDPYKCYCWHCCSDIFSTERKDAFRCSCTLNTFHCAPFLNENVMLKLFISISLDSSLSRHSTEFINFIARNFLLKLDRILKSKPFLDHVDYITLQNKDNDTNAYQVGAFFVRECLLLFFSTVTFHSP